MTPISLTETLAIQFRYTFNVVNATLEGIPEDDYFFAPDPGGNCLNWVLGHIVSSRNGMLAMLGREPVIDRDLEKRYRRGTPALTDREGSLDSPTLLEAFRRSQDVIISGLASLTPEALTEPAPFSPSNNPEETLGSLFAGLSFHESYHVGQLGILRRLTGADGVIK